MRLKQKLFSTKPKIKALIITDTHNHLTREMLSNVINNNDIELIITLGDISFNDWEILLENESFLSLPKFGVLGNHDDLYDIERINEKIILRDNPSFKIITHLHNAYIELKGLTFVGIDGSIRYKNTEVPLLTQKEALDILKNQPKADILISHNGLKKEKDESDTLSKNAHDGFYAIWHYMTKNKCFIHIHGHNHAPCVKTMGRYKSRCIYKLEVVDITKTKIY